MHVDERRSKINYELLPAADRMSLIKINETRGFANEIRSLLTNRMCLERRRQRTTDGNDLRFLELCKRTTWEQIRQARKDVPSLRNMNSGRSSRWVQITDRSERRITEIVIIIIVVVLNDSR